MLARKAIDSLTAGIAAASYQPQPAKDSSRLELHAWEVLPRFHFSMSLFAVRALAAPSGSTVPFDECALAGIDRLALHSPYGPVPNLASPFTFGHSATTSAGGDTTADNTVHDPALCRLIGGSFLSPMTWFIYLYGLNDVRVSTAETSWVMAGHTVGPNYGRGKVIAISRCSQYIKTGEPHSTLLFTSPETLKWKPTMTIRSVVLSVPIVSCAVSFTLAHLHWSRLYHGQRTSHQDLVGIIWITAYRVRRSRSIGPGRSHAETCSNSLQWLAHSG